MELFRVSRNAWGQEVLLGISWDLIWVFLGAALLFIVLHLAYKGLLEPRDVTPDERKED
ncbi:MAG: hypothetical protein V3S44_01275 [Alphaproteobacteria bacterium]